jgi:hypothetical protein
VESAMTGTKYYHIYLKDECVLNNLEEDKFKESWELLNTLVGFMHTDYSAEDLSYETY